MKSVMLVCSYTPSLVNFRLNLIRALIGEGYKVYAYGSVGFPEIEAILKSEKVSYFSLPLARTGLNPFKDWQTYQFLRSEIQSKQPEWVISYTVKPVIYSNLAASGLTKTKTLSLITGLGYFAMPSTTVLQQAVKSCMQYLYRRAFRHLNIAAFQNLEDVQFMRQADILKDNVSVIVTAGSGIDLKHYTASAPVVESPIRFLLIARLIKSKGVEQYLDAAEKLKAKYGKEVVCQLIGMPDRENPDSINLTRLESLADDGVIDFLGEQKDVRPFLEKCSVFVLPSYYREGVPRTLLEALATAKPIITTDNVGCRETVIPQKNGMLLPIRDTLALIEAMEYFLKNRESIHEMGAESLRLAKSRFDVEIVNKQLLDAMNAHKNLPET